MAVLSVGFDVASESHTGTTGSTSQTSFTWNHAGGGSARGALVFVFSAGTGGGSNPVTSVTYGGTSMTAVAYTASCTSTEPGAVKAYYLDNCGTGTQAVVVNRTSNTVAMYAVCFTVTGVQTEVYSAGVMTQAGSTSNTGASSNSSATGTLALKSVDDGSPGANSLRFMGRYQGSSSVTAAGSGSTAGPSIDFGAYVIDTFYESAAGQGARNVGGATVTDDIAAIALAVREVVTQKTGTAESGTGDDEYTALAKGPTWGNYSEIFSNTASSGTAKSGTAESGTGSEAATLAADRSATAESATGSDAQTRVAAVAGTAETGTGSETAAQIYPLSGTAESGTGGDSAALAAARSGTAETGTGSDTAVQGYERSSTAESGTGSESGAVTVPVSSTAESGTGSDSAALAAARSGTAESGTGSDTATAPTVDRAATAESGTGSDSSYLLQYKTGTVESGTGSDASSALGASVAGTVESGTGGDVGSLVALVSGSADSATGGDSASKSGTVWGDWSSTFSNSTSSATEKSGTAETGTGSESAGLAAARSGTAETGTGSESAGLAAARSGTAEVGTGSESASKTSSLTWTWGSWSSTYSNSTAPVTKTASDSATGFEDTFTLDRGSYPDETGHGLENASRFVVAGTHFVSDPDSVGLDAATLAVSLSEFTDNSERMEDSGSGVSNASVAIIQTDKAGADGGAGVDTASLFMGFIPKGGSPESGAAVEAAAVAAVLSASDSGTGTESGGRDQGTTASDSGGSTPQNIVSVIRAAGSGSWIGESNTYAVARSTATGQTSSCAVGQIDRSGSPHYTVYEAPLVFDTSGVPENIEILSAVLTLRGAQGYGTSHDFTVEARFLTAGTFAFVPGANLDSLPLLAHFASTDWHYGDVLDFTSDSMVSYIDTTGYTRMVLTSSRQRLNLAPDNIVTGEVVFYYSRDDDDFYPYLTVTYRDRLENSTVDRVPPVTDSGTGNDTQTVVAIIPGVSDSGAATSTTQIERPARTDSGQGIDTAYKAEAKYAAPDGGSGVEAGTLTTVIPASDEWHSVETSSYVNLMVTRSETAYASETSKVKDKGNCLAEEYALDGIGGKRRYKQRDAKTL